MDGRVFELGGARRFEPKNRKGARQPAAQIFRRVIDPFGTARVRQILDCF